ncbi:MAG: UbiA-like polyprenyltransferase [Thermoplasmataceae archaeon]|jgi:4-hydroxybenzoate polyprenyltransferase|nr:putative 4-hydroxybenzoate polyprenyltransferase [Candidatus Thermoplasmatota archaeon]
MNFREVVDYIKLEHTVFDLPFVFTGAVIASLGHFYPLKFILIFIATTSARATGMSINRIEGRKYDISNPRKKDWLLVKDRKNLQSAIILTVLLGSVFEVSSYLLNFFVFALSPIVIFLFFTDPFMKKITPWRHFYMGGTIGVGVLAGYLAITPSFPASPLIYLIFLGSSSWIAGFDMIYVIPDRIYDLKNGLKTVVTQYGTSRGMIISSITHAFTFACFLAAGFYVNSIIYDIILAPILFLIIYQHYIVNPDDPSTIRASFLGANSFIGILYLIGLIFSYFVV